MRGSRSELLRHTTEEEPGVGGLVSFYNAKVDVVVGGVPEDRPIGS